MEREPLLIDLFLNRGIRALTHDATAEEGGPEASKELSVGSAPGAAAGGGGGGAGSAPATSSSEPSPSGTAGDKKGGECIVA